MTLGPMGSRERQRISCHIKHKTAKSYSLIDLKRKLQLKANDHYFNFKITSKIKEELMKGIQHQGDLLTPFLLKNELQRSELTAVVRGQPV